MSSLFRLGQILRGKLGKYIITKEIQKTVWFATNQAEHTVVIKRFCGHFGMENERNILRRFQGCSSDLRPLLDEIEDPAKYGELADEETVAVILYLMEQIPQSELTPFHRTAEREVSPEDKEFIGKIMKMDPRDRPSAKELLQDPWFEEDASP